MKTSGRFLFLWKYVSREKFSLGISLAALTFVSGTSLLYPWLLKLMVDHLMHPAEEEAAPLMLAAALLGVFVASAIIGYYQQVGMHVMGFRLRNALRVDYLRALLCRPLGYFRDQQVGELSAGATEDIGKVQPVFLTVLAPMYQNALFILGSIVLMSIINVWAMLAVLGLMMVPLLLVVRYSGKVRTLSSISQALHARANASLEEVLVAIRDIKAFVRERKEIGRYSGLLEEAFQSELRSAKLHVRGNQALYLLLSVALLGIFFIGTTRFWTVGSAIAFYFYTYTMTMAIISVGKTWLSYQSLIGALDRIMNMMEEPVRSDAGGSEQRIGGAIRFVNVRFGYENQAGVLDGLSFSVGPGGWFLISGPSGSGKTTIANLLMRFYDPLSGEILIDGTPLPQLDPRALRSQIGYVGQDPILIHGSLRENLLFSDRATPGRALAEALECSCVSLFLAELPGGLDTVVGERGFTLSAGQKMRVALARAIIFDPAILILDEINGVFEPELEEAIWKNLRLTRAGRTTIILSHHGERIPSIDDRLMLDHRGIEPSLARHG